MKATIIKKIISLILIMILCISLIPTNISMAVTDYCITVGTGNFEITVTKDTTVEEISNVLGEPKIVTKSAFGGYAYTFYTDENYSNYLYIETLENGKIISYGSVDPTYKTSTYSYGDAYSYTENGILHGYLLNNNGSVEGGVYYNRNLINNSTDLINSFKKNYENNEIELLKGISEQAVTMYNALSTNLGYKTSLVFDEDVFYKNEQMKEFGTTIREYAFDMDKTSEFKAIGIKENMELSNDRYYIFNPMEFASLALRSLGTNFGEKNIAVFDYYSQEKLLSALTISKDFFDRIQDVELTNEEQEKLEAGRAEYKKAEENLNKESAMYKVEPQDEEASKLLAGELVDSKKQGITDYVNAIRVAAGIPKINADDTLFTIAQHIATLNSYRYKKLGLDIAHLPPKPDGVTDEFYQAAIGWQSIGYAENLGRGALKVSEEAMKTHINIFLDDSGENPQLFSHRTKILDQGYTKFGYGISNQMFSNEFSGATSIENEIEAWPSKGITFMETLENKRFDWTARFVKDYTVLDTTTATIECLNTGEKWNFDKEEKTSSRWFQCDTNLISSINNRVIMYDSSINPSAGEVYQITLHGIKNDATGETVDYTYRTVFEYADESNYPSESTSLSMKVPEEIEKISGTSYYAIPNEGTTKLSAILDDSITDVAITWKSSNPEVISVTQNGTLQVKSMSETPVTISVCLDSNNEIKSSIQVMPYEVQKLLKGDVNKDGKVRLYDALQILKQSILGGDLTDEMLYIMDYNDDGKVRLYDALKFLQQAILA